jgi:hypothetical protein
VVQRLSPDLKQGLADAALPHATIEIVPPAPAALPTPKPAPIPHVDLPQTVSPFRAVSGGGSRDLDCLTAAVYYEARGESAAGQAAVAQVVLNRVRSPVFPHTVCGVVYQGAGSRACQFSFACNGATDARHEPTAWSRARDVAGRALAGYVMSAVGGATHFRVARLGADWGGQMVKVAQVGQHFFFGFSGRRGAIRTVSTEASPVSSDLATAKLQAASDVKAVAAAAASQAAVVQTPILPIPPAIAPAAS